MSDELHIKVAELITKADIILGNHEERIKCNEDDIKKINKTLGQHVVYWSLTGLILLTIIGILFKG